MAIEVMGWGLVMQSKINPNTYDCYATENGSYVMSSKDWHPDTSIEQAMICTDKWTEMSGGYCEIIRNLNISTVSLYWNGDCLYSVNKPETALAICEAILKAVGEK